MRILCIVLILLNMVDATLTHILVVNGYGTETNPLMGLLVGSMAFFFVKVFAGLICVALLLHAHATKPRLALTTTAGGVVAYSAICVWNVSVFFV